MPAAPSPDLCDEAGCRQRLMALAPRFYVYVLHKPDGAPFYVGKGIGDRVLQHVREARSHARRLTHKLNTIRVIERNGGAVAYSLVHTCDDEADAHRVEMELVRSIGRYDLGLGPLTNQTDGGEGGSNPSAESRARRRATLSGEDAEDEQRRVANRFFQALLSVGSVPIKQLGSLRAEPLIAHPDPRRPTARQAAALAASAISSRTEIASAVRLPRVFEIEGHRFIIENGVGKDILKSGMATVIPQTSPEEELLELTPLGIAAIKTFIPRRLLVSSGVLAEE